MGRLAESLAVPLAAAIAQSASGQSRTPSLCGVLPTTCIINRVDTHSESDGAVVSHSVAWAQMARYHNDGYRYHISFHSLLFMGRFVLCSVECMRFMSWWVFSDLD